MKRILLAIAAISLLAATPSEVVPDLETQGFYLAPGAGATEDVVADAVAEASFAGGRLYVVVLDEEPASGATFFSDAVLDELGEGTVLTVAPETVGWVSNNDVWTDAEVDEAGDASLDGSSDDDVLALFIGSLTGAEIVPGGGVGSGGGGGGSGLIWFLVVAVGLVGLFFFLRRRSLQTATIANRARLDEFNTAAQSKLNDIANDILEMEEEVALSENPEVQEHYDSASEAYANLVDSIPTSGSADQLADVTHRLDVAIWELDVAEALLDGKKPPEKPATPVVEVPSNWPPQQTSPAPPPAPPDTFDRRPQRQSSPVGGDLGNILLAILAAQNLGGPSRGSTWGRPSGPPGGGFGGGSGGGGGGRIRGGGRRRG